MQLSQWLEEPECLNGCNSALHLSGCTSEGQAGTGRQESPSPIAKEAHWGFPGEDRQNWRENGDDFFASDGKQLSLDTA